MNDLKIEDSQASELKKLGFPLKEYDLSKTHDTPSLWEVVDWLRKEKHISLCSYPDGYQGEPLRGWVCDIAIEENGVMDFCFLNNDDSELRLFKNYEAAILFGIGCCIRYLSIKQF